MVNITVRADQPGPLINPNIYGHFAEHLGRCIDEGLWVGEGSPILNTRGIRNDVVAALKQIKAPVLRWPGGCFADEYHWKDGIGPRTSRVPMVNTHWGGVPETNQFGTHEYFDLCEQIGCEPYVNGNVGSGTVREMQEWVEYITHDGPSPMADLRRANGREQPWKMTYFGVGNETWGCGGNMRPEYYADEYRRYATYVRNLGGNKVFKIACGPNGEDYHWTETLMREAGRHMDALTLHYYTVPTGEWGRKGAATGFTEDEYFVTLHKALHMDELVRKHSAIMDRHDPQKRVALIVDEWGTWYDPEPGTNAGFLYQQNTVRDALLAGLTLNIFNAHAERVRMANLAQAVNVLQALILTDGPRMALTPTYHVFDLYKAHMNAHRLPWDLDGGVYAHGARSIPQVQASASRSGDGTVNVTVCNSSPHDGVELACHVSGVEFGTVAAQTVTGDAMDAHNTFDAPERVKPAPLAAHVSDGAASVTLPPMSVSLLQFRPGE